jgi:hypothetical protein
MSRYKDEQEKKEKQQQTKSSELFTCSNRMSRVRMEIDMYFIIGRFLRFVVVVVLLVFIRLLRAIRSIQ